MIKKLRLTDVIRKTHDKDGKPFVAKATGKPYTRLFIKTEEHGDQLISGFGNKSNEAWKAGEEVTLEITEVKKDDKVYLNFAPVNMETRMMEMINELSKRVRKLELDATKGYHYPEMKDEHKNLDEINAELDALQEPPEEIPF